MQDLSRRLKADRKSLGLVPTMGALHDGHLSLVRRSGEENDRTVVTVFVNPAQFGPDEDFEKYPRDLDGDMEKLSDAGVHAVFTPESSEMYPDGFSTSIDVGYMGKVLCGTARPGHFGGVAAVLAKLFNMIMPDRVYLGQKDFQQSVIVRKLVKDLNFNTEVIVCPIVREPDGLAMSSRNVYLNEEERMASLILSRALTMGQELIQSKGIDDAAAVKKEMEKLIKSEPLAELEYIDVVDTHSLKSIQRVLFAAAICGALKIGNTRLIDNVIVEKV